MSSSKLIFDIKDNDTKDIFNNIPFLINISGQVNICEVRCGQEIDSCNSIKINTMTNYGNILSLNTDANIKCNVKLPYESEGDNKSYVFKKIFITVPSLHRINSTIYDLEIFTVFSSIQKNGTKLNLVLCTLLSGTNSVPTSGDSKLLTYTLLNELFSGKNTVPEKFGTASINLVPNPVDLNSFIPSSGNRSFYSYTHPNNLNTNIRIFTSSLLVSNNILSILKNKLTPGNSYTNMKNTINTSINPNTGLFFYYSEDFTNNYTSFSSNKDDNIEKFNDNDIGKVKKIKNNIKKSINNIKKSINKKSINKKSINKKTKSSKNKSKKEKFTNKDDDIEEFDDDDIEEFDDDDDDDDKEEFDDDKEEFDDDDKEEFDDDDESLDEDDETESKKIEKYKDTVSKTADNFVDTDNKNIVSVIIYLGFMLSSLLFLYIIICNFINNPRENPLNPTNKKYFMEMFNKSPDFKYSTLYKISFIILYILCIFLGFVLLIYLLLFFYNPTKFLIRSSTTLLWFIYIFAFISIICMGLYVKFRLKTNERPDNAEYSDCDKYTFKMLFQGDIPIKNVIKSFFSGNDLTNINNEDNSLNDKLLSGGADPIKNPIPGLSSKSILNKTGEKLDSINSTIESLNPVWLIVYMLFIPFVFILSCYLFPSTDNIYSGYVKDFVRSGGFFSVIYSCLYLIIFLASFSITGVYINKNYLDIKSSSMIMILLFIITLIIFISIYLSKMITFMKAFFIFLLVFLCIFLLFMVYVFYKKYFYVENTDNTNTNNNSLSRSSKLSVSNNNEYNESSDNSTSYMENESISSDSGSTSNLNLSNLVSSRPTSSVASSSTRKTNNLNSISRVASSSTGLTNNLNSTSPVASSSTGATNKLKSPVAIPKTAPITGSTSTSPVASSSTGETNKSKSPVKNSESSSESSDSSVRTEL
jgi:hypothetical protein